MRIREIRGSNLFEREFNITSAEFQNTFSGTCRCSTRITPSSEVISTINDSPYLFQISMAFKHLCGADTGSLHQPYDEAVA